MSSTSPLMIPTSSSTQTTLPDWYTNYAMQVLSNQQAIAANPLATYQGPRTADFTAPQEAAFTQATDAATAFQPGLAGATAATGAVDPNAGSTAATPYLQQSDQTAPSVVDNYMNPYTKDVVDQIATLGNRNLTEKVIPAINDQFIANGGYGDSRNAEIIGRAGRDAQTAISNAQGQALNTGYTGAVTAAQTDLQRQGALGTTAGSLAQSGATTGLAQGTQEADLAAKLQSLGLTGAGALQTIGGQQQTLNQTNLDKAYQDFLTQQANPQVQQGALISALTGVQPAVPKLTESAGVNSAINPTTGQPLYPQSTLSQVVGGATTIADLLKSLGVTS